MQFIKRFIVEDEGAEAVEWALLVVVLGLAIVAGGPSLKDGLSGALTGIGNKTNDSAGNMKAVS